MPELLIELLNAGNARIAETDFSAQLVSTEDGGELAVVEASGAIVDQVFAENGIQAPAGSTYTVNITPDEPATIIGAEISVNGEVLGRVEDLTAANQLLGAIVDQGVAANQQP